MAIVGKVVRLVGTMRADGIAGVLKLLASKLEAPQRGKNPPDSLWDVAPLFRFATCDDLIQLKARYPDYCSPDREAKNGYAWGLKPAGMLFCVDKILRLRPTTMLEVGAGWNTYFDAHFGEKTEYWMIDDGAFDPLGKFDQAVRNRQHTHFVRGLLGDFSPELPADYFDLVFSVSVLEHVPTVRKPEVYSDMYRTLKPGGWIAHSIDLSEDEGRREYEHILRAGFVLPRAPHLHLSVRPSEGPATLFEPLEVVFNAYFGMGRPDKWRNLRSVRRHWPTILVMGRKPEAQQSDSLDEGKARR